MSFDAVLRGIRATRDAAATITVTRSALLLLSSIWLAATANLPLWRTIWVATGGPRADNFLFLLSVPVVVLSWIYLLLNLLAWGRATKAVLLLALVVSAALGYFMNAYGVLLDDVMVENVLQTHSTEALELVTWRLGAWLLGFGVLPAVLIARARVHRRAWLHELTEKLATMIIALACLAGLLLANYSHYATLLRNHRELRFMLVPQNIVAAARAQILQRLTPPATLQAIGTDARRAPGPAPAAKPALTVLVIGETARAANFSLNGYARPTNPELAHEHVIGFFNVSACGTSTAVSLPCMFLDVGRDGFSDTLVRRREGLLDVLRHAGVHVKWHDNNSGCKGVCDRIPHDALTAARSDATCPQGECYDEALLQALQRDLDNLAGDAVIVLHMKGSHGPSYWKRYPRTFEYFTPVCATAQLDRCTRDNIVNAYDNSLRYSDHVLSQVIELLRRNARRFDAAMLYVSDHGESLGENGLYLHGMPYALAPREQIEVPMLLWISNALGRRRGIDIACLDRQRRKPISHDYLFHTVLSLSGVTTAIYRPERDVLRACRS